MSVQYVKPIFPTFTFLQQNLLNNPFFSPRIGNAFNYHMMNYFMYVLQFLSFGFISIDLSCKA